MEDNYLERFYELFEQMPRQGPGDDDSARRLLDALSVSGPGPLRHIADMGCGSGAGTLWLARHTDAEIDVLDNYRPFLQRLEREARAQGLAQRITTHAADMAAPPFPPEHFDLIWSEGAAYLIGFTQALALWRPLLRSGAHLVVTEMCWFTDTPSPEARAFWAEGYPEMATPAQRIAQAKAAGYKVLRRFRLPPRAFNRFHRDLRQRLEILRARHGDHQVYRECEQEIALFRNNRGAFGYFCLLLQKTDR
ncbi:MAG: class I SAM-dependent methyltransferase [Candidatus Sedimenticola endophacoides]